jgi:hypothetical protein
MTKQVVTNAGLVQNYSKANAEEYAKQRARLIEEENKLDQRPFNHNKDNIDDIYGIEDNDIMNKRLEEVIGHPEGEKIKASEAVEKYIKGLTKREIAVGLVCVIAEKRHSPDIMELLHRLSKSED